MTNCTSFTQLIGKLYNEYKALTKNLVSSVAGGGGAALALVPEVYDEMIKAFNRIVGAQSWAHIGPRLLPLDQWESGTVVGSGDRAFITAVPMDQDSVKLCIKERSGKNKVSLRVCSFDEAGQHKEHVDVMLNDAKDDKKDDSETWSYTLKGVAGRYVTVILDGKSLTNSFKYKLMLDT